MGYLYRMEFKLSRSQAGLSLVEVLVVTGIMGFLVLAMMTMQQNQLKANNYLEFQLKRTQLQNTLVRQILNDPNNCACLFAGASSFPATPAAPGATLAGVSPKKIGRYDFVSTGVCATATIPQPLVDDVGIDGLKATAIQLTKIMNISGVYSGELLVNLQSTKSVLGPKDLSVRIPVSINTAPAGADVSFVSCSTAAPSSSGIQFVRASTSKISPSPLAFSIPSGLSNLSVIIGASGYMNLPNDKGRTIRADYFVTFSPTGSPVKVASIGSGAGNNNGAQVSFYGATAGMIPVPSDATSFSITRENLVLDYNGSTLCHGVGASLDSSCNIGYSQLSTTVFGY